MEGKIPIIIKSVQYTQQWGSFSLMCTELELGSKVVFCTTFYDPDGKIVETFKDVIEGEEYLAWGNDDQYILNLIAARHQVVIEPSV